MTSVPREIRLAVEKSLRAQNALVPSTERLDNAVTNSRNNGLPPIAISAAQGQYLAMQCQLINAESVLEIGTLGGYSTIWFANSVSRHTSNKH